MTNKTKNRPSGCPITFALDTFGDRWNLLVIREIMFKGNVTYSDFMEIEEKIASNILIDRLKHLEKEGILEKSRDPENRRSFLYALTQKGRDLAPVILEIVKWSGKHDPRPQAQRELLRKIETDHEGFKNELLTGKA